MALETHHVMSLSVRVWSDGDGPPLLYLHGYDQHPGGAAFLERLAQRRRVFAPEHPGYGESDPIPDLESILDVVLHLRELVSSWEVGTVDVVGHSLGGMFAGELAAICPHLVRKLVLVDAFGLWLDGIEQADPFLLDPGALRRAKWHDPDSAPSPEPSIFEADPDDPLAEVITAAQNLAMATKFLWPLPDRGLARRLPLVKAPTLVVHGASDGLVPMATAERMAELVTGASIVVIPDAGHLPMVENEDAFIDVVEQFLGQ